MARSLFATFLLAGCTGAAPSDAPDPFAYDLACDYLRHSKGAELLCVRLNTSTGDAKLVDVGRVKQSGGAPAMTAAGAGAYQLACKTTRAADGDAFTCLRMDRRTGELVRLSLPDIGKVH